MVYVSSTIDNKCRTSSRKSVYTSLHDDDDTDDFPRVFKLHFVFLNVVLVLNDKLLNLHCKCEIAAAHIANHLTWWMFHIYNVNVHLLQKPYQLLFKNMDLHLAIASSADVVRFNCGINRKQFVRVNMNINCLQNMALSRLLKDVPLGACAKHLIWLHCALWT